MKNLARVFVVFLVLSLISMAVACVGNIDDKIKEDPIYYSITFDTGGGSRHEPISLIEGAKVGELPIPTKEGAEFAYWEIRDLNGNLSPYSHLESMPAKSFVLYAHWDITYYRVVFDIGEGTELRNGSTNQLIPYMGSAILPYCARKGYILDHWDGNYTEVTQDTNITAVWIPSIFICSFLPDSDDAVLVSGASTHTINYGESITPPVYTRDGYTFIEWQFSRAGVDLSNITQGFIATAIWDAKVTGIFNGNGGELSEGSEIQVLEKGTPAIPPKYTKIGYKFTGFSYNPLQLNINHVIFDFTATAKWEILSYIVSFSPGCEDSTKISGEESQSIVHGSPSLPPTYVREGYVFIGWTLEPENADLQNVQCNIAATADWKEGYLVTFEPCGGTLVSGDLVQIIENGNSAEAPVLEKEGFDYSFDTAYENITDTTNIKAVWYTSGLKFEESENGYKVKSTAFLSSLEVEEVIIPATYKCLPVDEISEEAFKGNVFITTVILPGTIRLINKEAFMECTNLTSINLPSGMYGISEYAFANCSSLLGISIENSTFTNIEQGVFSGCSSLVSLVLPSSISNIKEYAFKGCTSLETVEIFMVESVPFGEIGDYAFDGCSSLATFTIPTNINGLGKCVFQGCTSLTSMVIPNKIKIIQDYLFANCVNLENITIGNETITIGEYAFYECNNMKAITIPGTLESIGEKAFSGCSSLIALSLINVNTIGAYAFEDCEKITNLYPLSNQLTIINEGVFSGCKKLQYFIIPEGVTKLSTKAFADCTSFTSFSVPFNVKNIEKGAFSGCTGLGKMTLYFIGENRLATEKKALFGYIFGDTYYLESEPTDQFYTSQGGVHVTTYYIPTSLKEITIPVREQLPYGAFSNCKNLTEVKTQEGIATMGARAFYGCSNLNEYIIPANITAIASYAFYGCESMQSLTIPNNITAVGEYAFYNCSSLEGITLPEGITLLENYLFGGCSNIETIEMLGDVTSIGNGAFWNCSKLDNLRLPSTVITIGNSAFYGCSDLHNIDIPSGVTSIGESAFGGCYSLTELSLPSLIAEIQSSLLSDLTLDLLILPNGITTIEGQERTSIKNILIHKNVETIATGAFGVDLATVFFKGNDADWDEFIVGKEVTFGDDIEILYYSEIQQTGYWHLDENSKPVIWE